MSFHYATVNYQIPLHFRLKRGEPPLEEVSGSLNLNLTLEIPKLELKLAGLEWPTSNGRGPFIFREIHIPKFLDSATLYSEVKNSKLKMATPIYNLNFEMDYR